MKNYLYLLFGTFILSCNSENEEDVFPTLKNLSEFKNTEFILTPEHHLTAGKNSIYCSTFLFAWDALRTEAGEKITIDKKLKDLTLVQHSRFFEKSLSEDEMEISAEMVGDEIKASAYFRKSLPFETIFDKVEQPMQFGLAYVQFFGCSGYDEWERKKQVKILYYKNDSDFIVELIPKDPSHQIIVCMPGKKLDSFGGYYTDLEKKNSIGKKDVENEKTGWKMNFLASDVFSMPIISFNIENDYKELLDNPFLIGQVEYRIVRAYQQIAFVLNERGAEIESKAEVEGKKDAEEIEETEHPKKW